MGSVVALLVPGVGGEAVDEKCNVLHYYLLGLTRTLEVVPERPQA